MPPPSPRPLTLFTLIPMNKAALATVNYSDNAPFVSQLGDKLVFDIGHTRAKPCGTLVTLGRGKNADIFLDSPSLSRIQCSFVINPDTNVVMLHDLSSQSSTQVFGLPSTPFENDRKRQVVVCSTMNTMLGMGGEGRDLYTFQLCWRGDLTNTLKEIKLRKEADASISYEEDPRVMRTVDEKATAKESPRFDLRIQVPSRPRIRYMTPENARVGNGQFGQVFKVLDMDTGTFLAVKKLSLPAAGSWEAVAQKREIEVLSRSRHPYIVEFVAHQLQDEFSLNIFMALKEGSVESLVNQIIGESTTLENYNTRIATVGGAVFTQMLSALDFLAYNGVVHRDVKPPNILYDTTGEGTYNFYLGDFGLCNKTTIAETARTGTLLYMAPEVYSSPDPQAISGTGSQAKADVRSLFATMLWILDVNGYRRRSSAFTYQEAVGAVVHAADNSTEMAKIREMVILRPELRASAAQMLLKIGEAKELTTPQNRIPALTRCQNPIPAPQAPIPAPNPSRFSVLGPAPRREETPTSDFATTHSTQTPSPWRPLTPQSNSPAIPTRRTRRTRRSARIANQK